MKELIKKVQNVPEEIKDVVDKRLGEFREFRNKGNEEWFSELCFCLLTANSKARTALNIQNELGFKGFSSHSQEKIRDAIKRNKHRFHNNKAKYIFEARPHVRIKDTIHGIIAEKSLLEAREWLVNNIKGLGYKEASHFLRNVGFDGIAILDRHIINLMHEHNILKERPKSLSRVNYLLIEQEFNKLAEKAGMSSAEMDLTMWYLKAGEVLK
jgi:N-glycosylase/DNA lyase